VSSTTLAPDALLVLEDGTAFRGHALGRRGETFGEAVFDTGMSGYQEVLTDPSYRRQIVTMTAPHVGTYGLDDAATESRGVQVAGFVVREASRVVSSWRASPTLDGYLDDAGVVGIEGVDTRRLTLHIRAAGAMRAAISTVDHDPGSLTERVRAHPGMEGADLAADVSCATPYEAATVVGAVQAAEGRPVFRVAAYDFGVKRNILRLLQAHGCDTTVFPATTPARELLRSGFDGVFLSNGPGDPAVTSYGIEAARGCLEAGFPTFGICLGHQLVGAALGGRTYKLKFGHRGVNQPVLDAETGRIEVTSHNHGFAVDPDAWATEERSDGNGRRIAGTDFGDVVLNRWNLNDGTLEGVRCLDVPAFTVQYHPEAAPGPHDARHLFDAFRELMSRA
jgi:carbamoyl-phosphate synthase small subunit